MSVIVDAGAIPALVKHLKEPEFVPDSEVHGGIRHFEYEVEKGSAVALGFLAIKVMIFILHFCLHWNFPFR